MENLSKKNVSLPNMYASAGYANLGKEIVIRGKYLHEDCLKLTYMQHLLFSITGKIFPVNKASFIEKLLIATGYPDAKIWCNRISAYLGSARVSAFYSASASIAASNSLVYGGEAFVLSYQMQQSIPDNYEEREKWLAVKIKTKEKLHGFGRPIEKTDERIIVSLELMFNFKINAGNMLKKVFWIDQKLKKKKGIHLNFGGFVVASLSDLGLSFHEINQFLPILFYTGYTAVYNDQMERDALSFLPNYHSSR